MKDSLLSLNVGAPLAVAVVVLLFWIEYRSATGRGSPWLVKAVAAVATVALVVLSVSRFVAYS